MGTEQTQQQSGVVSGNAPLAAPPTKKHASTTIVENMLANGQREPEAYATILRQHPEAEAEILAVLHKTVGNAFVQQVVESEKKGPGDKPKAQKGHVLVESEGQWEDLKAHGKSGFSKYGGGKVRDKLVELVNAGQLKLTGTQIAVFDAVSQVETGGQIGCVQTYDDQVVSVGFKQVVLGHGSLEKMMTKAPAGFAKHGLSLDSSKTYKKAGWSKQPHQIVGCPDVEVLRTPEWAIKFYHASMEPDVIAAMCELLAHEQGIVDKAIDREGGVNENYFDDATAKSWLLETYNNRPAFTEKAIERAGKKAAANREEFLDTLSAAIIETYVVEEPKLHFNKAKKAAAKKGKKLTPEQETQLLADMKKKYEPIGRKKGTNIVTKIGRKVTPPKLAAGSTAANTNTPAPTQANAPAQTPTQAPTPAPATNTPPVMPAVAEQPDVHVEADEVDDVEIAAPAEEKTNTVPETPAPAPAKATEVPDARTAPVVEAAGTDAPKPFRVTAKGLNVRAGAGTDHEIVGGLKRGDTIDVTGREGKWMMTTHEDKPAFVHGHYVEPAEAATVEVEAPKPKKQPPKDTATQATRPPKPTAPSQRADETPWWFEEETAKPQAQADPKVAAGVDPKAVASAAADTAAAIGHGVLDAVDPFGWFHDDGNQPAPAGPTATTKPAAPAKAKPAPTPAPTKPANTESPIGALSPADLHNETLEHMVATMNNAQVTEIAGSLAGLKAKSAELKKKASRKEERGKGRDDLVEGIRVLRGKLDALGAGLDKQQVTAFKTAVYRTLNEIAPYYFQSRNVDILEYPPADKTRTCNLTCIGMALESVGRNAEMFTGDREAVMAAARVYQHKLVGDDKSDEAFDATAGTGTTWANLTGMRFPDFLELVAIAKEMTKGDLSEASVKAGAAAAWNSILVWDNIEKLTEQFKASCSKKLFNASGIKPDKKKKIKHDYQILDAHGEKHRSAVEKYINAKNQADETGKEAHKAKAEKLRPAYEAAIAAEGDDRIALDTYKDHVRDVIGADLDAGKSVIVGLSGHFVRLQSIHEDFVLVNDPARDSRSLTKLSYAEARAMGYFQVRFVIH